MENVGEIAPPSAIRPLERRSPTRPDQSLATWAAAMPIERPVKEEDSLP